MQRPPRQRQLATPKRAACRAAGTSFYSGMRLLPRARREAMYAIYAFCREVDDIADGDAPRAGEAARSSQRWRARSTRCSPAAAAPADARSPHPVAPLRPAGARIPRRDRRHGDGCGEPTSARPTGPTLDLYCGWVAGAVGLLSVRVFGVDGERRPRASPHHLGRALQLTNILRDLDEDAARGRLYLPREVLQRHGIAEPRPAGARCADPAPRRRPATRSPRAPKRISREAERHHGAGDRAGAMRRRAGHGDVYRAHPRRLIARGWRPPRPARVHGRKLLWLAVLRYGLL